MCIYTYSTYTHAMRENLLFLRNQDIHMISDEVYNYSLEYHFPLREAYIISRYFPHWVLLMFNINIL